MTGAAEWQGRVGQTWAALADQTDRSLAPVTAALLAHPAVSSFDHALDIGCGAGELSCALAAARPDSEVTGVDISADLIAVARSRCPRAIFEIADAAAYRATPAPDLLISRHGVMFFPDPITAFASLCAGAAPGAVLRFSCFRERRDNEWAGALAGVVGSSPAAGGDRAPGPFAFGDPGYVEGVLTRAGWLEVTIEPLDYLMVAAVGAQAEAVDEAVAYFRRIGPAAGPLAALDGKDKDQALRRLRELLADNHAHGQVALPAAVWIVTARAPV